MTIKVHGSLKGSVKAPVSKSDLHRLILASALSHNSRKTIITGYTPSQDISATAQVLASAGADISFLEDEVHIVGVPARQDLPIKTKVFPDCGESGSTLRFLVPVFAALGLNARFLGHGRLEHRPMQALTSQLSCHGITVAVPEDLAFSLPLSISGQLTAGDYSFSGNISSQYITGLMFALPLLDGDSCLTLSSPLESRGYVDMSLDVLARFGIQIHPLESGCGSQGWHIPGRQAYKSPEELRAQGDWSSGAFWLCAGAVSELLQGDKIVLTGINTSSLQGDMAICSILQQMGANLFVNPSKAGDSVICSGGSLHGITIDASQIPDLIPVLSVVAAVAHGTTYITNAGRLRIKESDRLAVMAANLNAIGADVTELEDGLIIRGKQSLQGNCAVDSCNDHRIAMSMAVASLRCREPVIIKDAMCVKKSYPAFYEDFKMLGGIADVLNLG